MKFFMTNQKFKYLYLQNYNILQIYCNIYYNILQIFYICKITNQHWLIIEVTIELSFLKIFFIL